MSEPEDRDGRRIRVSRDRRGHVERIDTSGGRHALPPTSGPFVEGRRDEGKDVVKHGRDAIEVIKQGRPHAEAPGPDEDGEFEADLEYLLAKNAELCRRLAR